MSRAARTLDLILRVAEVCQAAGSGSRIDSPRVNCRRPHLCKRTLARSSFICRIKLSRHAAPFWIRLGRPVGKRAPLSAGVEKQFVLAAGRGAAGAGVKLNSDCVDVAGGRGNQATDGPCLTNASGTTGRALPIKRACMRRPRIPSAARPGSGAPSAATPAHMPTRGAGGRRLRRLGPKGHGPRHAGRAGLHPVGRHAAKQCVRDA